MFVYSGKLVYPIDHLVVQRIQQKGWNAQWFLHYVRFIVFMFVKHSLRRCVSKTAVHADLSVHLLYFPKSFPNVQTLYGNSESSTKCITNTVKYHVYCSFLPSSF